jgi:hypothetical protein
MHRTGTSVTTAILNALGVSLSEDLMPPTQFNAMGYFESVAISKIHDRILAALGSSWNTSELFVPFPNGWWKLPQIAPFKQQLVAQVTNELERVAGVWGFKDPRTARLMPLWKDIINEMGLDARYVMVVRDPNDVAKSLFARECVPPIISELLWLEHYVDAIAQIGVANLHAIVDYARWFEAPIEQAEYLIHGLGFESPGEEVVRSCINRVVSTDLRHHHSAASATILPYPNELYEALARRDVDTVQMLSELFDVTKVFSQKMVGLAQQASSEQLADARQALQRHAQRIAELEHELAAVRTA